MAKNTALVAGPDSNGSTVAPLVVTANGKAMYIDDNEIDSPGQRLNLSTNSNKGMKVDGPCNNGSSTAGVINILEDGGKRMQIDGNAIDSSSSLYVNYYTKQNVYMVTNGGKVGIGTTAHDNLLEVAGTIRAYELILESGWSDFVFEPGYDLMTLPEVEQYIAENGRLPGLPSASEVQEHGLPVGDAQALLLQKVEELTLRLIEQGKQIEQLRARVSACNQSSL